MYIEGVIFPGKSVTSLVEVYFSG